MLENSQLTTTRQLQAYQKRPSTDFNQMMGIGKEVHCRYVWSYRIAEDNSPWRAIGTRQSGKKTCKLSQFYLDASIGRDCSMDCFVSPNQFFDWRNSKQLASLHANWLEIDINTPAGTTRETKKSLSKEQETQVVSEVFNQLEEQGVPLPTGYVLSGSGGVHLYWMYGGVDAYKWRVAAWRDIASSLVSKLKGGDLWHVDLGASKDPARVLRMPGSRHGSTKRTVEYYSCGDIFSFEELAKSLSVEIAKPRHLTLVQPASANIKPRKAPPKDPKVYENPNGGKHTIGQWWFKIYTHILTHINNNPVKEGMRDSTAFILYVALRHIQDEEAAYQRVRKLNESHIGLTDEELAKYLKTAKTTLYKYKKDSIADYLHRQLGMDVSFLYKEKTKLSPEEVKAARQAAAETTAKKKAESTLGRILRAAKELLSQNVPPTQVSVAAICGRSERTVRRYWSEVMSHPVIRSASIYSPPHECPVGA